MMNLICLIGSPHGKKGNTARLAAEVLKGAKRHGAAAEIIILRGSTVRPCRGCDQCHIQGRCPQRDRFEEIKKMILSADGLLLASPNYINHVSAQLKAFIDRCCGVVHCMSFEGKYGAAVVTSGGGPEKMIADYMNRFLISTGIHPVGSVCATMMDHPNDRFTAHTREKAFRLGERLVQAWRRKKRFKRVDKQMDAFRRRMEWLISYRKADWSYEYRYWRKNKGLK